MPQIILGDDFKSTNGIVWAFQDISGTHTISETSLEGDSNSKNAFICNCCI